MKTLAVIAPQVGVLSETFIMRHIRDLNPGRTVVVTHNVLDPEQGHWTADAPTLNLARTRWGGLNQGFAELIKRRLRLSDIQSPVLSEVRSFLLRHRVDVILSQYLDASLPFIDLANEMNVPFYAHAHGYDVSERLLDPHYRRRYLSLSSASGVITMSHHSASKLSELGIDREKISVVPYGVRCGPPQVSSRVRASDSEIRCLAVGRMVAKKCPLMLLESFRLAYERCPALRLDYVGEGTLLHTAAQFVKTYKLEDRVTLHGAQPHAAVNALLAEADIFLQHSKTDAVTGDEEGLPVAILEAMAHSLPVVSTLHAGIPEAVENEHSGLLVAPGDYSGMADAVLRLAGEPLLRKSMGEAGRNIVREKFTWERERNTLSALLGLSQEQVGSSDAYR